MQYMMHVLRQHVVSYLLNFNVVLDVDMNKNPVPNFPEIVTPLTLLLLWFCYVLLLP